MAVVDPSNMQKMRTYTTYYKNGQLAKRFQARPKDGAEPNTKACI